MTRSCEQDPFDWPIIKRRICTELAPRRLVNSMERDRQRNNHPWTTVGFTTWTREKMPEALFSELVENTIERIRSDEDTSAVLDRLDRLGFRYLLGTYDEPGRRLFQLDVEHNEDAERRALGEDR